MRANSMIVAMTRADQALLRTLLQRRRPRLDSAMRLITKIGDWPVSVSTAVALACGAVPEFSDLGRLALWALVTSHLAVQLLKRRVCRSRPALPVGLASLIEPEDRFSFPSGHAAAGLSLALPAFMVLVGPIAWIVLCAGLMIGVSRCYLGVHYPGDVLMGWVLAACAVVVGSSIGLGL